MCVQVPRPALELGHLIERRPEWCFPKDTDHLHGKQRFLLGQILIRAELNAIFY